MQGHNVPVEHICYKTVSEGSLRGTLLFEIKLTETGENLNVKQIHENLISGIKKIRPKERAVMIDTTELDEYDLSVDELFLLLNDSGFFIISVFNGELTRPVYLSRATMKIGVITTPDWAQPAVDELWYRPKELKHIELEDNVRWSGTRFYLDIENRKFPGSSVFEFLQTSKIPWRVLGKSYRVDLFPEPEAENGSE